MTCPIVRYGHTSQQGGGDSDARSVWGPNVQPQPDLAHGAQPLGTRRGTAPSGPRRSVRWAVDLTPFARRRAERVSEHPRETGGFGEPPPAGDREDRITKALGRDVFAAFLESPRADP